MFHQRYGGFHKWEYPQIPAIGDPPFMEAPIYCMISRCVWNWGMPPHICNSIGNMMRFAIKFGTFPIENGNVGVVQTHISHFWWDILPLYPQKMSGFCPYWWNPNLCWHLAAFQAPEWFGERFHHFGLLTSQWWKMYMYIWWEKTYIHTFQHFDGEMSQFFGNLVAGGVWLVQFGAPSSAALEAEIDGFLFPISSSSI